MFWESGVLWPVQQLEHSEITGVPQWNSSWAWHARRAPHSLGPRIAWELSSPLLLRLGWYAARKAKRWDSLLLLVEKTKFLKRISTWSKSEKNNFNQNMLWWEITSSAVRATIFSESAEQELKDYEGKKRQWLALPTRALNICKWTKLVFQDQLFLIMCYSDAQWMQSRGCNCYNSNNDRNISENTKGISDYIKTLGLFFFFFPGILFSEDSLLLYKYQQNISFDISTCFLGQRKN